MEQGRSIVEYFGDHERYRCGYCGSADTNYSHGMWAHSMTVQDYQDLIDRGWRRSGKYCYKPTMKMTCCPHYTIKQDTPNFKISKSQKKVIKMVNKYLIHGIRRGDKQDGGSETSITEGAGSDDVERLEKVVPSDLKLKDGAPVTDKLKTEHLPTRDEDSNVNSEEGGIKGDKSTVTASSSESTSHAKQEGMEMDLKKNRPINPGSGADPSKPACRKAKDLRKERKMQKLASRGEIVTEKKTKEAEGKTLEELLNEPGQAENVAHKLETRLVLVNPPSSEYRTSFTDSHRTFKTYQMRIHKEPEKECTKQDYEQFLCNSPLEPQRRQGGPARGYGSFHQQYYLDGKLIAVGVIDILPQCVSSVYLYYDPEYSFLSLGTYSALREIAFVRDLQKKTPELRYYYMGYYIHSCPKMRYKGQYYPSFLVCPETFTWIPIEKCRPKLDASAYSRLEEEGLVDPNGQIDMDRVLVLHDSEAMPYEVYRFLCPNANDDEEVLEYAKMVGRTCAQRILLFRK